MSTPQEHDARLLELLRDEAKLENEVDRLGKYIAHKEELGVKPWETSSFENAVSRRLAAVIALAEARRSTTVHEAEYTGWQRYFLVTSSAGHVHRSTSCSTCFPTTGFALLPTMSDHKVDDLVVAVGAALCSVCFPDAPVSWLDQEKIPTSVTMKLFEEGSEAFRVALDKLRAKRAVAAAKAADMAAQGKRKRPRKARYEGMRTYLDRYPAAEGWY